MISVAFDVNGTLTQECVRWLLRSIDRQKAHVVVWSTMGIDYCKTYCEGMDIKPDEYLKKQAKRVDIAFDDFPHSIERADEVIGV